MKKINTFTYFYVYMKDLSEVKNDWRENFFSLFFDVTQLHL